MVTSVVPKIAKYVDKNVSSYVEDGLYGRDPVAHSSPVLRTCIETFFQDVGLTTKSRFLEGHPPTTNTKTI